MAALETWKTAMSSITFSVFLEITVLLKKIYQLKPKKSSFPLPLSLPSDTKTWRNPYSWNYFHEKYTWDLCWSMSNNIKLTALCWQYNSSVEDSFGGKIDQRFMRTKCLPRAPVRDHCVMTHKVLCWRHFKQQEHWDYPHFQKFHHKDTAYSSDNPRDFWTTQWLKASISF